MNQFAQLRELMKVQCDMATQPYKIQAKQAEAEAQMTMSQYQTNQLKFQLEDRKKETMFDEDDAILKRLDKIQNYRERLEFRKEQLDAAAQGQTVDYSADPEYQLMKTRMDKLISEA
jgi:hypothetical protein